MTNEKYGALRCLYLVQVRSQLCAIIRPMYSSPQIHGAKIVSTVSNAFVEGETRRFSVLIDQGFLFVCRRYNSENLEWCIVVDVLCPLRLCCIPEY